MLISFVVPVYNAEKYLHQCIESLLRQTYKDIEVILVNDGSNDHSAEICDNFAKTDNRVCVFHKDNEGVHTARNLGISKAKGKYIMFVDADDWLELTTAECVSKIIEQHEPDIVRFTYVREFQNKSIKKGNVFLKEGLSVGPSCKKIYRQTIGLVRDELCHIECFNFLATACTSAYSRKLLRMLEVKFEPRDPIGSFEDGLFNLKLAPNVQSFYYIDEAFYHYRKTNIESCTAGYRRNYLQKQTYLFEQLYEIALSENDPDIMQAFFNRVNFSYVELCLNAIKSGESRKEQCKEIKQILCNPIHIQAREKLRLHDFPLKWRIFFFLIKHRMILPIFGMTKMMHFIQKRGR